MVSGMRSTLSCSLSQYDMSTMEAEWLHMSAQHIVSGMHSATVSRLQNVP